MRREKHTCARVWRKDRLARYEERWSNHQILFCNREELGYALMLAGKPDECIAARSPALKKEEGGFWHAMNCLKELGRYEEAIAYGETLLRTEPENAPSYRGLALSYRAAGKEQQARFILSKAIRRFEGV